MEPHDYQYKIIIIGDSSTGKSCLAERFTLDKYNYDSITTIGIEFFQQYISSNNAIIKLQIWDTAGQETYQSICKSYYRDAAGVILCFDNKKSFSNLPKWMKAIKDNCLDNCQILLVGTKSDINNVPATEIDNFITRHDLDYISTSAKNSSNVNECFKKITDLVYATGQFNKRVNKMEPKKASFFCCI